MYHFFVERSQIQETKIVILGQDVNHIKNVLRIKTGEEVKISSKDGTGKDYLTKVKEILEEEVILDILEDDLEGNELPSKVYLFQGLPKSDKMDMIIQKTVELGIHQIIPVSMKRSIVKLDEKKQESKLKRWNTIAESAAKQAQRTDLPSVEKVMTMKEAIEFSKSLDLVLVPYENAKGILYTKEVLEELRPNTSVGIFIGPEGGFEPDEIMSLQGDNVRIISLGRRILRTETAGFTCLSLVMFQLEQFFQ